MSGPQRVAAALAALGLLAVLLVAAALRPDPWGRGTHQQLGLPPCSMVLLFGRPCPSCGMTTAWACVVRGDLPAAFAANAGGALLALGAVAAVPWLLASAAAGRWRAWQPNTLVLALAALAVVAVALIQWGGRLMSWYT